jgi:lipopolysaccharide/colanic/teichoic acid biosynthesis glycosyltransferase
VCNEAQVSAWPKVLKDHPLWPAKLVGLVLPNASPEHVAPYHTEVSVLGQPADLSKILESHVVDEIVVVQPFECAETERIAQCCTQRGLIFRNFIELPSCPLGGYQAHDLGKGAYLLSLEPISQNGASLLLKRVLDIVGSLVGLLLFLPVYFLFVRRLERETSATAIFTQTRVGKNGRRFSLYKLRTMHSDAATQAANLVLCNEMRGPIFKVKDDPRVTPTGRVLRERHLDELPQFWNVLKGEMSLVGTRPPTTSEVEAYDAHHYRRLSIKPGLTGLWQLEGNDKVPDFEDVVKLDCEYIENWSLWLDFKLIARTVVKMLSGTAW